MSAKKTEAAIERKPVDFRPMAQTESDLALYADCFARNDTPREMAGLRWLHVENPTGQCMVELALPSETASSSHLAGIYAVLPVWARVAGRRVLACQSLDTLTDTAYRGQGLFVRMARSTYARAAADAFSFVYGFPNGSSAHGFFERLGWSSLDPIPFLARPLRTGLVTKRLFPRAGWLPDVLLPAPRPALASGQDLRAVSRFGPAHEEVWNAFSAGVGIAIERDAAYLNWRLRDKPAEGYRVVGLLEHGRLLGFVAYVVSDKHGGRIGYLLELLHLPQRPDAAAILARAAVADMSAQRADLVLAWCFPHSPNRPALERVGFVDFPERYRPVELHLGVAPLALASADEKRLITSRESWYVSYLDSDTV